MPEANASSPRVAAAVAADQPVPANPTIPANGNVTGPYRRDITVIALTVLFSCIFAWLLYDFFLVPPKIDVQKAYNTNVVDLIYTDAFWSANSI